MINNSVPKKDLYKKYFGEKGKTDPVENLSNDEDIVNRIVERAKNKGKNDSFGKNFVEGLEQGTKGLLGGFAYASGEVADRLGFDEAGQKTKQAAEEWIATAPASDDSVGQFFGSIVPSTVPSATAIVMSGGTMVPAMLSMTGLGVSSTGNGMMEYDAYKRARGEEPDDNAKMFVGLAYGVAEAGAERLSLNKLIPNFAGKMFLKGNVKHAEKAGERIFEAYRKSNPEGAKALLNKVRTGMTYEGLEEVITEVAQTATNAFYKEREDIRGEIEALPGNVLKAFAGGSIMGGALGPLSFNAQNRANRERRRTNGGVVLAQASGQPFELIEYASEGELEGYRALNKYGEEEFVPSETIEDMVELSNDQFDKLLQDKFDVQEFDLHQRKPVRIGKYNNEEVEVVGEDESGDYWIRQGEEEKLVQKELVADIQEISPEEQYLAEGNEIVTGLDGPVEALTGMVDEEIDEEKRLEPVEDVNGDFIMPGQAGYEEAVEAIKPIEYTIGSGNKAQKVSLNKAGEGLYEVGLITELVHGEPNQRSVNELTDEEKVKVAASLNKAVKARGMNAFTKLSDPQDEFSPLIIQVARPKRKEEKEQTPTIDQYQIQADGARVKVINPEGKEVGSQSKYYLPKVREYFTSNAEFYSDMQRVTDSPDVDENNYLKEIASTSENPVELSEAYIEALQRAEEERGVSHKEIAIANDLSSSRIPPSDLHGRNIDGGIFFAQYTDSKSDTDIAQRAEYLSDQIGQEVTVDDILEFIKNNPGGPRSVLNKKNKLVSRIEDRFREVTGTELSKALAQSITDANSQFTGTLPVEGEGDRGLETKFESQENEVQVEIAEIEQIRQEEPTIEELNAIEEELRNEGVSENEIRGIKEKADEYPDETIQAIESQIESSEAEEQAFKEVSVFFEELAANNSKGEEALKPEPTPVEATDEGEVQGEVGTSVDTSPDSEERHYRIKKRDGRDWELVEEVYDAEQGKEDLKQAFIEKNELTLIKTEEEYSEFFPEEADFDGEGYYDNSGWFTLGVDEEISNYSYDVYRHAVVPESELKDYGLKDSSEESYNELINQIEKLGLDYSTDKSNVSNSKYITVELGDGEEVKIRHSNHVLPPSYEAPDYEVGSHLEGGSVESAIRWLKEKKEETGVNRAEKTQPLPTPETSPVSILKDNKNDVNSEPKEYSSTQFNLDLPEVVEFARSIPQQELYEEEGADQYGIEEETHVTALFGLTTDKAEDVSKVVEGFGEIKLKLGKTSLFENEKYDVLKIDVESDELRRLNKLLSESLENENEYPDYKPHVTIAYLKSGEGKKYARDSRFEGKKITVDELLFSGKDRVKTSIKLGTGVNDSETDLIKEAESYVDGTYNNGLNKLVVISARKVGVGKVEFELSDGTNISFTEERFYNAVDKGRFRVENKADLKEENQDEPLFKKSQEGPSTSKTETLTLTQPESGTRTFAIKGYLDNLIKDWQVKDYINIVDSPDQLPLLLRNRIENEEGLTSGVYYAGKAYVLAYNIKDVATAERTLNHEVIGHLGIRGLLNHLSHSKADFEGRLNALSKEVHDRFKADDYYKEIISKYRLDPGRFDDDRVIAAQEYIAHLAETNTEEGITKKFINFLEDLIRALGFQKQMTRNDLKKLLSDARKFVDSEATLIKDGVLMTAFKFDQYAPTYYSQMTNVLHAKLPGKGTPESFKQMIQAYSRKGDFRTEELEWSGLIEWLDEQSGKITRDEILGYMRDNTLQLGEVMRAGSEDFSGFPYEYAIEWLEGDYEAVPEQYESIVEEYGLEGNIPQQLLEMLNRGGLGRFYAGLFDSIQVGWNNLSDSDKADYLGVEPEELQETKFTEYTLPEGSDYKELLITLPLPKISFQEWNEIRESWGKEPGTIEEYNRLKLTHGGFKTKHWDERNVLAHVRFNTREGNTLFIEEIQSDWHQKGRKKGYKGKNLKYKILLEYGNPDNPVAEFETEEEAYKQMLLMQEELGEKLTVLEPKDQNAGKIPDAPFKTTWHELVMKRMIRYASENGFEQVGWTPGEAQNERYNLADKVSSIEVAAIKDNKVELQITSNEGTPIDLSNIDNIEISGSDGYYLVKKSDLSEVVGKELAERIIEGGEYKEYEGVDLEIGGEGMKGFYDKVLVASTNKYIKKWGSKVGTSTDIVNGHTVWFFPITDRMREVVLSQGQPLFKRADILQEKPHQYQKGLDRKIRNFQDKFIDVKRIQKGVKDDGGVVTDDSDMYADSTLYMGRVEYWKEKFTNQYEKPMLKELKNINREKGVSYEEVWDYLYAKHAPERNEFLQEKNPDGGNAQSGWSNEKAQGTLTRLEKDGKLEAIEKVANEKIYPIFDFVLNRRLETGLISQERHDQLKSQFEYYVPLRGFKDLITIDPTVYSGDMKMEGRQSEAGDILAYTLAMADTAIVQGEKNRLKQTVLEFALKNYSRSDILSIKNVYWKGTGDYNDEGKEIFTPVFNPDSQDILNENVKKFLDMEKESGVWPEKGTDGNPFFDSNISVMHKGKPVVITFKHPHIAQAINGIGVDNAPKAFSFLNRYMSYLRNFITQYSPEFALRNLARDSMTGFINLGIDFTAPTATAITNPARLAKAWNAVRKYYRKGDFEGEWGEAYQGFMKNGGISGWWQLNQVQERTKNLQREIEKGSLGQNFLKGGVDGVKAMGEFLDDYNRAFENVVRVSTYKYLLDKKVINPKTKKPYTPKQAAAYGKDLTVNFNRRGRYGNSIGSFFLFFNASIQGISRQVQPFFSDEKRTQLRAFGAPIVMASTAVAFIEAMRYSMGQDDDDEYYYDKIPEWTRHHNIILPNLLSDDPADYLKIPLPYGYNVYWAAGDVFDRITRGITTLEDGMLSITTAALDSYNPIGTQSGDTAFEAGVKSVTPTVLQPGWEIAMNKNFAGMPIKPEPFPFAPETPQSQQYFKYVSSWAKEMSRWLNEVSGGDDITSGYVDVSPEHLEYVAEYYGGGTARFLTGIVSTVENIVDDLRGDDNLSADDIYDVPFARSVYGRVSDNVNRSRFIENRKEISNTVSNYKKYAERSADEAESYYMDNKKLIDLEPELKAVEKQLRYYQKLRRLNAGNSDKKAKSFEKELTQAINELMVSFNKKYNRATKKNLNALLHTD